MFRNEGALLSAAVLLAPAGVLGYISPFDCPNAAVAPQPTGAISWWYVGGVMG